jgi:hypothetical protein
MNCEDIKLLEFIHWLYKLSPLSEVPLFRLLHWLYFPTENSDVNLSIKAMFSYNEF